MKANYMSVIEAARALDLSPWTVRNLCRLGKLPAKRKRHGWIIPRALIEAMVQEHKELIGEGIPNAAMIEYEEHVK